MANGESKHVEIHVEDLKSFFNESGSEELMSNILANTLRYQDLFSKVIDQQMPERSNDTDPVSVLR